MKARSKTSFPFLKGIATSQNNRLCVAERQYPALLITSNKAHQSDFRQLFVDFANMASRQDSTAAFNGNENARANDFGAAAFDAAYKADGEVGGMFKNCSGNIVRQGMFPRHGRLYNAFRKIGTGMSTPAPQDNRFLHGWIEPHAGMLTIPQPGQALFKILRAEHLIQSLAQNYLHFTRVDTYCDFSGFDSHDGEQLPGDLATNAAIKFEKAETFSAGDYYARSRSRTYACCLSLDNSEHVWREYGNGGAHGKVGLEFDFDKLRARLNVSLHPDACRLQANGVSCLQIFSVNYGLVDYVERATHRENQVRLPNPIRYVYLKDKTYAPERELRVSLSALGIGQFVLDDGSEMVFSDRLQVQFDYRAAFADGTIKQILAGPGLDADYLRTELANLNIGTIETVK